MKYVLLFLIFCVTYIAQIQAQNAFTFRINFEDTTSYKLYGGSFVIPQKAYHCKNLWQVATPHKKVFDSACSKPYVIITDSANSYIPNDTSVFMFVLADNIWKDPFRISFNYFVNTDSLKAYGDIDFSYDNGRHWHNLFTDTFFTKYTIWHYKPVLTGNSMGWQFAYVSIEPHWILEIPYTLYDTTIWRFSFIGDSTHSAKDGLMFDNLLIQNYAEGINEISPAVFPSQALPNPAHAAFIISYANKDNKPFVFTLTDALGRVVQYKENITAHSVEVDTHTLQTGVYFYTLTNKAYNLRSAGKVVVQ